MVTFVSLFVCFFTNPAWSLLCDSAYSCVGQSIFSNGTSVDCQGLESCSGASTSIAVIGNQAAVLCTGSHACYNAINITVDDSSSGRIGCYGLSSCSNVGYMYSIGSLIDCNGEKSCSYSNIAAIDTTLSCYGFQSCAYATITAGTTVSFYGALSGRGASMESFDFATTWNFYGESSGLGARLTCGHRHTCTVNCFGNACNGLEWVCEQCQTFSVTCGNNAERSGLCPDGEDVTDSSPWYGVNNADVSAGGFMWPTLQDMDVIDLSSDANSLDLCDEAGALLCGNVSDTGCQTSEFASDATVCCSAFEACRERTVSPNVAGSNDIALRCDGFFSCFQLNDTVVENGGDIVFSAANSGGMFQYNNFELVATSASDVVCSGGYSCLYNVMRNLNDVYFIAGLASQDATIEDVNNVFVHGWYGLYRAEVYNVRANVYCLATSACISTDFNNVAGKIVAQGVGALSATITNVTTLVCNGYQSCRSPTLWAVSNIYAYGESALYNTWIRSGLSGLDGIVNEMKIEINGSASGVEVWCQVGDTCRLDCQSSNACTDVLMYCNDNCYVNCDESAGIDCPTADFEKWDRTKEIETSPTSTSAAAENDDSLQSTIEAAEDILTSNAGVVADTTEAVDGDGSVAGSENDEDGSYQETIIFIVLIVCVTVVLVVIATYVFVLLKRKQGVNGSQRKGSIPLNNVESLPVTDGQ